MAIDRRFNVILGIISVFLAIPIEDHGFEELFS